jgi:hypothetical protein
MVHDSMLSQAIDGLFRSIKTLGQMQKESTFTIRFNLAGEGTPSVSQTSEPETYHGP